MKLNTKLNNEKINLLGIVVALKAEAKIFYKKRKLKYKFDNNEWDIYNIYTQKGHTAILLRCGIGTKHASHASQWLTLHGARVLASMGICGGLSPKLKSGDIIICNACYEYPKSIHGSLPSNLWSPQDSYAKYIYKILTTANITPTYYGTIASMNDVILSAETKNTIYKTSGALGVDMESAAVARTAFELNVPFFAVRVVCDAYDQDIPAEILPILNSNGEINILSLIQQLSKYPFILKNLILMNKTFRTALGSLKTAWRHLYASMQ